MKYFFMYLGFSILSSWECRKTALRLITEIGTVSRYYPKWYVAPARWVKKLFKLQRRLIPRFIYFELFLSLFFAALCPINTLICAISGFDPIVTVVLVWIHAGITFLNLVYRAVMSHVMKRKPLNKE